MKTYKYLGAVVSLLFLVSCTKVIDINLNSAAKKYVIEAVLTDQPGNCKVKITQTKDFDENNTFPGVSGATVTITDSLTNTVTTLTETQAGIYESATLTGAEGKNYKLNVNITGQQFTASSTMPALVNFDSLYVTDETLVSKSYKVANVALQDPVGKGNSYRFDQYRNDTLIKQIYVRNDDYNDGRSIVAKLYIFGDSTPQDANGDDIETKTGDTLKVNFFCIEKPIYTYWYSLNESATGTGNSAAPANPVSNITGGALGYFSAQTIRTKTVVVP